jgi:hypothetical protein
MLQFLMHSYRMSYSLKVVIESAKVHNDKEMEKRKAAYRRVITTAGSVALACYFWKSIQLGLWGSFVK